MGTLIGFKEQLKKLRVKYQDIVKKVNDSSELEKLDANELIVDTEQYEITLNENQKEMDAVREEIKYENIGRQLIMRRIKEQCWDGMSEKLQNVKGIKAKDLTVNSFPILAHDKNKELLIKKLQFLRKMNIIEKEWSTKTQDRVRTEFDVKKPVSDNNIGYIWDVNELSNEQREKQKNEKLEDKNNNYD